MPQLPSFGGSDSLYCEATHNSDEVLCYGSDDEYYESPLVRISCLEEQARQYLEGRRPFLLSASLRGPFDKGLWENPWNGRGDTARFINDLSSHPQRRRLGSAQKQSNNVAPEPASAPILELGTTPDITVYTDGLPPVSRKRAATADWLRRKNLKRMRSHDAAPAMAPSPTMRRRHSANLSRSISVPTDADGMTMDENEALLSGRQCLADPSALNIRDTGKRKHLAEKQRPVLSRVPGNIGRSMSVPADLQWQNAPMPLHQSLASTKDMDKDIIVGAESQKQNEVVRHTQPAVKVEREGSGVLLNTDRDTDLTTKSSMTEFEVRVTDDGLGIVSTLPASPNGVSDVSSCSPEQKPIVQGSGSPLSRETSPTVEEHVNDEASQQLLDELNKTKETAIIKNESETEELTLQAQPCFPAAESELSSIPSLGTDTDAADSAEDTTGVTWHTDNNSLVTGAVENCDKETLPETAPSRLLLEKAEHTNRSVGIAAATSQAMSLDVRLGADSVDASVSSSLTNLPTSPCSPEHAEAAALYKIPVEQVQETAVAVPLSGAPPSTPETKQSSLPTPDMSVSIKSFRRFRSPTPTPPPRRRPNKPGHPRPILSYPRQKSSRLPGPARQDRRVRFVLPDDDANDGVPFTYTYDLPDANAEENEEGDPMDVFKRSQGQGQLGSSRTASPPPRDGALTGTLPSEVEKFQCHFTSVANRTKQAEHQPSPPELTNCGPQRCSVAALPGAGHPLQEQRAFWQSPATVRPENKILDEAAGGVDKENQANDWKSRHCGEGDEEDEELPVDDVQEVLDNLDDFLGLWSIEAELAQARSEHV